MFNRIPLPIVRASRITVLTAVLFLLQLGAVAHAQENIAQIPEPARTWVVAGVNSLPASAEAVVSVYPSDLILVSSGATGVFQGHDWEIARFDDPEWRFYAADDGDLVWEQQFDKLWQLFDSAAGQTVDLGRIVTSGLPKKVVGSGSILFSPNVGEQKIFATGNVALPNPAANGYSFFVTNNSAGPVFVTVMGDGTINGSGSYALAAAYDSATFIQNASGDYRVASLSACP